MSNNTMPDLAGLIPAEMLAEFDAREAANTLPRCPATVQVAADGTVTITVEKALAHIGVRSYRTKNDRTAKVKGVSFELPQITIAGRTLRPAITGKWGKSELVF